MDASRPARAIGEHADACQERTVAGILIELDAAAVTDTLISAGADIYCNCRALRGCSKSVIALHHEVAGRSFEGFVV